MNDLLSQKIMSHKSGRAIGMFSVCSAHRLVIEAALDQAAADHSLVCIESTSNQVDQYGGYTGMQPVDFMAYVAALAAAKKFPLDRIILGGDHLGPNAWQKEPAAAAMDKAHVLIRDYVLAGFRKIHLDASMRLGDDPAGPLADAVVARRSAELCRTAETAFGEWKKTNPQTLALQYVIGTEVPIPGGAQEKEETLAVTSVKDAERTIQVTQEAFFKLDLREAWSRVIGVVVQPGVEFGDATVHGYDRARARELSSLIEEYGGLVYEAHSTDYQDRTALCQMVEDHFAILKVGPALTFALREAFFSLEGMEQELLGKTRGAVLSGLGPVLEKAMLENPQHWQKHYHGSEEEQAYARRFSYSDRCRYYWPLPAIQSAVDRLLANLSCRTLPLTLLSQYLPLQYQKVRSGRLLPQPRNLVYDKIREVTESYSAAVGDRPV